MKEITINSKTYGIVKTQVDDDIYDRVHMLNWNVTESRGSLYATARQFYPDNKKRKIKLHQIVMYGYDATKYVIDHRDNNTLNNLRSNLRLATFQENTHNRKPTRNKKCPFKGVNLSYKKYYVTITINGERIMGGGYRNPVDAAKRYNELALQYHGEFAYQNPV